jgi:4-hydroxybenzoate polyprenyltransferase
MTLLETIIDYGRLVRFSHTVFALPFALAALALAWSSYPITLRTFSWILVAMVGARTAAMGFNRLVDRRFDALNPRTSDWELPRGKVTVRATAALTAGAALLFVGAAYQLNDLCFILSPLALAIIFFYSLTKRFTWTSHFFLGLALSLAPVGAWLAVSGWPPSLGALAVPALLGLAVLFWLAGFDMIYSLQDYDFDRKHGLYSVPVRFGVPAALALSGASHLVTVVLLGMVGVKAQLGLIYWIGIGLIFVILLWEHLLVTPRDLSKINRAFFDFNAYVSIGYLLFTAVDILLARGPLWR